MHFRRLSWKLVLGNSVLFLAAVALAGWSVASAGSATPLALLAAPRVAFPLFLIAAGAIAASAWGLRRLWSRPLSHIIEAARSLSRGNLSAGAEPAGGDELALLARALNRMRDRLAGHVDTIDGQRRMLESLLTQLHEGVIVVDAGARVVLLNPAAARLLELTPEHAGSSFVGMSLERCIPQHDLQRMLTIQARDTDADPPNWRGALSASAGAVHEERVQVDAASGARQLLAHASDMLLPALRTDATSWVAGRLLVLTDITTLSRALQIKTDFVSSASHELRTPLSTIRAAVETLLTLSPDDAASAARFIEVIDRQSRRLEALATDLLDLARLESPGARFESRAVPVHGVLEELRTQFADRAAAKGLRLEFDVAALRRATIWVNPHLLRLVLDNLFDNAVKFTDAGGSVRLSIRETDDGAAIEIADTGCGISPEDCERVFERFYQVERARSGRERGTGLGLSIVRHAVAAMGGQVRLESKLGEGTRVRVAIPQRGMPGSD
ncbi:MAG: ATP-binding protein [Phycisphaerae bacterium]